ncbi:MAG: DNA/RNA nuclease SfsA [Rhodobacteraceae bacterium]|nr:DNA/RNA nuclease SfsA [Paracoccaceae bacterium]
MRLSSPLVKATLLRRYKRFLADVRLEDGTELTAHVANPGALMGLCDPGLTIWLSRSSDPKRKLPYSWELAELPEGHLCGVSTAHPNRIVEEALRARGIEPLAAYGGLRREVKYGKASRVDFLLTEPDLPDAYVEVKNVHLRREADWAEFPDSVTARGAKHLEELGDMAEEGHRAVMLYCIQRTDCARFKLAADLDKKYAAGFQRATARGVEAYAYACNISSPEASMPEICLAEAMPLTPPP